MIKILVSKYKARKFVSDTAVIDDELQLEIKTLVTEHDNLLKLALLF
jgi:hypothetical protein